MHTTIAAPEIPPNSNINVQQAMCVYTRAEGQTGTQHPLLQCSDGMSDDLKETDRFESAMENFFVVLVLKRGNCV
jgi:hypothetical protein